MARIAALLTAAILACAGAGAARAAGPIVLKGTVALKAFDVSKECKWSGTKNGTRVGCTIYGAYVGVPARALAGYGWIWDVPAYGKNAHYGFERGTLVLNFGTLGDVSLSLTGQQKPLGKQTTDHAEVVTTGAWKMTNGTAILAGGHGKGTYTYTIVRSGPASVFFPARLVLDGSIVRAVAPA